MYTRVSKVHMMFYTLRKGHTVPGNQGIHDKLNEIQKIIVVDISLHPLSITISQYCIDYKPLQNLAIALRKIVNNLFFCSKYKICFLYFCSTELLLIETVNLILVLLQYIMPFHLKQKCYLKTI